MADKYTLRRQILDAVRACEPAGARYGDVAQAPAIEMNPAVTPEQLGEEIKGLVAAGYLADLMPGRMPLLRLSLKGRLQADRETDLDEFVWGEYASRFAAGSGGE